MPSSPKTPEALQADARFQLGSSRLSGGRSLAEGLASPPGSRGPGLLFLGFGFRVHLGLGVGLPFWGLGFMLAFWGFRVWVSGLVFRIAFGVIQGF